MAQEKRFDEDTPLYTISTVAKMLGVSVHTLRLYEHEGLVMPFKKESSHRLYSDTDIERLNCIRKAITKQKFSIPAIKTIYSLIPCWEIVHCTKEDRTKCDFFNSHGSPCWTFKHSNNYCTGRTCRNCDVYKHYAYCDKIKDAIKTKE